MRTKRAKGSVDAHEADGLAVGIVGERGVFTALDLDDPRAFVGEHEGDAVFFGGRREAAERPVAAAGAAAWADIADRLSMSRQTSAKPLQLAAELSAGRF
jgi:hypothetical protein